jgi:hypothetical protein
MLCFTTFNGIIELFYPLFLNISNSKFLKNEGELGASIFIMGVDRNSKEKLDFYLEKVFVS